MASEPLRDAPAPLAPLPTRAELARQDLANAVRKPKMIHRERVPGGPDAPMVAYFRAGVLWRVYWRAETPGAELVGSFLSLDEARRDAEATLAPPLRLA